MVRPIAFGTVARDALPDQIAAPLIAERQLKAGDRLPPERELAASMGVSRWSLREALRALSMLGVTQMRHGDGTAAARGAWPACARRDRSTTAGSSRRSRRATPSGRAPPCWNIWRTSNVAAGRRRHDD